MIAARASIAACLVLAACSKSTAISLAFPPGFDRGTELAVLHVNGTVTASAHALDAERIDLPLDLEEGTDFVLEALHYDATLAELGLTEGPIAPIAGTTPRLNPNATYSASLSSREWAAVEPSAEARAFRPLEDPTCVPIASVRCGVHELTGLSSRPIEPAEAPWTLDRFSEDRARGVLLGMSDRAVIIFDENADYRATTFLLDDFGGFPRSLAALRDGSGFIVASEMYEDLLDPYNFHRIDVARDATRIARVTGVEPIFDVPAARPRGMVHLGLGDDHPLYLFGAVSILHAPEPAIYACNDGPADCRRAGVDLCDALLPADVEPGEGVLLASGIAVAVSPKALYLKPRVEGRVDPSPNDRWTCAPTDGELSLRGIASVEDRIFICAEAPAPPGEQRPRVVMTASVSAAPGEVPVVHLRPVESAIAGDRCIDASSVPGDPTRVRVLFAGEHTVDYDAAGHVVGRADLTPLESPDAGAYAHLALRTGAMVAIGTANRVLASNGAERFRRIYGEANHHPRFWEKLIAHGDDFYAITRNVELYRIGPDAALTRVRDPHGLLAGIDVLRDGVVDHRASRDSGDVTLLVGGSIFGSGPKIRRIELDTKTSTTPEIARAEEVVFEAYVAEDTFHGIAELGEDRFAAITTNARIFDVRGVRATELDLDFDAVDTPEIERRPAELLDAFIAIDGSACAAWAVGTGGFVVRAAAQKVARLMPSIHRSDGSTAPAIDARLLVVDASCPDRIVIAGNAGGAVETGRTLYGWTVAPRFASEEACFSSGSSGEDARGLELRELEERGDRQCMNLSGAYEIRYGTPLAFLDDGTEGALLLNNGFITRFRPEKVLRAPGPVSVAAQSERGDVLFGWGDGVLGLGSAR